MCIFEQTKKGMKFKMKRILFYFSGIYNGGTEIETLNLMKALNKEEYEFLYYYQDKDNSYSKMLDKYNEVAKYENIYLPIEIDTLIYCTQASTEIKTIIKNVRYKNAYFWFHYFGDGQEEFLIDGIENKYIDKVITVSKYAKDKLISICPKAKDMIEIIHNILQVQEIKQKSKINISIEKGKTLTLTTVARFAPIKGYTRVKYLAELLMKENIDFKWYVLGKGSNKKEHDEVVNLLKDYSNNIIMMGHKDNPYCYMKNSDYTVLLSERETSGLVITESKIVGTPCIVTDFEAAFEQITDLKNGIILPKNDMENWKDRIKEIVKEKDSLKNNIKGFNYNVYNIKKKWEKLL